MSEQWEKLFDAPAPEPDKQVKEAAWQAAALEYHRSQHQQQRAARARARWWIPLSAAAAILCMFLINYPQQPAVMQPPLAEHSENIDIQQVFLQGRELFGNKLEAVTISHGQVTWHLAEDATPGLQSDQLLVLTLQEKGDSSQFIAATPGVRVPVNYHGQTKQVEFLPDPSDQVIAYGNDIYWDSSEAASPIRDQRIITLN